MTNEPFKEYCCRYWHNGSWWCIDFPATSREDAAERLKQIGLTGKVDGELVMTIPAGSGSWLPSLIAGVRNALFGGRS